MVVVTIDGRRRKITKREAIGTQMVKSASADLRATKMLIDLMKDVEHKAADAAPPPEPRHWPRRTRRWCSNSWRGCGIRSCKRPKKRPPAQELSKHRAEKRERIRPFAEAGPTIGDRRR